MFYDVKYHQTLIDVNGGRRVDVAAACLVAALSRSQGGYDCACLNQLRRSDVVARSGDGG